MEYPRIIRRERLECDRECLILLPAIKPQKLSAVLPIVHLVEDGIHLRQLPDAV